MTLKNLESNIAKDWIKEQNISWRITRNFGWRQDCKLTCGIDRVKFTTLFTWELNKCKDLDLITEQEISNLLTMLGSKNPSDIDLGRRMLGNLRSKRLKLSK